MVKWLPSLMIITIYPRTVSIMCEGVIYNMFCLLPLNRSMGLPIDIQTTQDHSPPSFYIVEKNFTPTKVMLTTCLITSKISDLL